MCSRVTIPSLVADANAGRPADAAFLARARALLHDQEAKELGCSPDDECV
jgi:hypothetical protein